MTQIYALRYTLCIRTAHKIEISYNI